MFERFESVASFLRLIVAHLEWPDIALHLPQQVVVEPGLAHELRVEGCHNEVPLLAGRRAGPRTSRAPRRRADALDPRRADEDAAHRVRRRRARRGRPRRSRPGGRRRCVAP